MSVPDRPEKIMSGVNVVDENNRSIAKLSSMSSDQRILQRDISKELSQLTLTDDDRNIRTCVGRINRLQYNPNLSTPTIMYIDGMLLPSTASVQERSQCISTESRSDHRRRGGSPSQEASKAKANAPNPLRVRGRSRRRTIKRVATSARRIGIN